MISSITNDAVSINDLYVEFGLQVHPVLDEERQIELVAGINYSPRQELSARRNVMINS